MPLVSQACALAFHAMAFLPEPRQSSMSLRELAKRLHLSEAHMAKVVRQLARGRLVRSKRGPGGGFVLARNPSTIRMREVYECISGKLRHQTCVFDKPRCGKETCAMCSIVRDVHDLFMRSLGKTFLSDIRGKLASGGVK